MEVEYKITLGQDTFTLRSEVKNEIEFFEKLAFYSSLPKTGPNGETDLRISHRTTKDGHNYYSLVSETAGQEFQFGQLTAKNGGGLFPKGWAPIYRGDSAEGTSTNSEAPRANGLTRTPRATTTVASVETQVASTPKAAPAVTTAAHTTPAVAGVQNATDIVKKYAPNTSGGNGNVNGLLRR